MATISLYTRERIEKVFGSALRYPGECEALSIDIEDRTGTPLSVNTLKRLLGILPQVRQPRLSTLDILARYIGFPNWNLYLEEVVREAIGDGGEAATVPDKPLLLSYGNGDSVQLSPRGDGVFTVTETTEKRLRSGESIFLELARSGYPLSLVRMAPGGAHGERVILGGVTGVTIASLPA